jgi:thioredoxin-like negative regulator of GroEL
LAVVVAATMIALFVVNRFLANLEHAEIRNEAEQRYQNGKELLAAGRTPEAVDQLQKAQALVRRQDRFALGFAEALIAAGRTEEAQAKLHEVLNRSSNDGLANLLMARLMAGARDHAAADSFYHRAIYGTWNSDAAANRLKARLELAEYLARRRAAQQLFPEVLILQSQAEGNPALQRKVAELFMAADSPSRASAIYRQLARQNPQDVDAYKGAGEADLLAGDYRSAQNAFIAALRRDPRDTAIASRLRFAATLAQLDPTPRRLRSSEKYRRSIQLIEMLKESIEQCAGPTAEEAQPALEEANKAIADRPRGAITNELTEERLDLAGRLHQARLKLCPGSVASPDAAALIVQKLAQ